MNKQEKPPKRMPYRPAWRAANPSNRRLRLRVSGRGVKAFALFAIRGLWKILRFALTELYIILFKSNAYLTRSNGKFGSSPRRNSGGGGGYHANSGHGEVDLPWAKRDSK